MRKLARIVLLVGSGLLMGCGGPSLVPRAKAPEANTGQTKCAVASSRSNPLVTEWPASEKANLEVRLREGGVVVAYSGCEMQLITECRPGGRYGWQRTTPATDVIEIKSEDELYAKLPLGAVSLEGELLSSGRLSMKTTISGQLRLTGLQPTQVRRAGPCARGTHLLTSLSVGAFKLNSGGTLQASASGSVAGVGNAGAGTKSSERLLREAGAAEKCAESTDQQPNGECRSPIQMFLQPLPWVAAQQAPAGTIAVEFVSAAGDVTWEVVSGGEAICETPCNRFVRPSTRFKMRETDPSFTRPGAELDVPNLKPLAPAAPLQVQGHPTSTGLFATGTTFTAFGGIAVVVGVVLTPVGAANGDDGMLKAGLTTGIIGAAVLIPSIILLVHSRAHAEIVGDNGEIAVGPALLGPGYIRGSF